jgi:hypothetical protein
MAIIALCVCGGISQQEEIPKSLRANDAKTCAEAQSAYREMGVTKIEITVDFGAVQKYIPGNHSACLVKIDDQILQLNIPRSKST